MPFYLDTDQRRVGWKGSILDDEAEDALIAYRLSDKTILYAEPRWRRTPYYNGSRTHFELNAVIEFLPTAAQRIYDSIIPETPIEQAYLLGLEWGHWGGEPTISFSPSIGPRTPGMEWRSDSHIIDRWPCTREEVRSKFANGRSTPASQR